MCSAFTIFLSSKLYMNYISVIIASTIFHIVDNLKLKRKQVEINDSEAEGGSDGGKLKEAACRYQHDDSKDNDHP